MRRKNSKFCQEERKKFNVDAFGRYKGGCTVAFLIIFFPNLLFETRKKLLLIIKVPRKEGGHKRGGALSNPGVLHEPLIHI